MISFKIPQVQRNLLDIIVLSTTRENSKSWEITDDMQRFHRRDEGVDLPEEAFEEDVLRKTDR